MRQFCKKKEITSTGLGKQQVLSKCLVALNCCQQHEMMMILLLLLLSLFPRLLLLLLLLKSSASNKEIPLITSDGNWMSNSFFDSPPQHTHPFGFFPLKQKETVREEIYTQAHKCLTAKMVECICQKSTTLCQGQTCDFIFPH